MGDPGELVDEAMAIVSSIAEDLRGSRRRIAVAESLTGGKIAAQLAAGENSAEWFAGGVVAYQSEVKFRVLGVPRGPVVTEPTAKQMARGVAELLDADIAVSVTGAGGPESQDGQPVGTVFIGLYSAAGDNVQQHHFDGDPAEVIAATTVAALRMLAAGIRSA